MGFPRQGYWSGFPCPSPGDLPDPGIEPVSPALAGGFFIIEPPGDNPRLVPKSAQPFPCPPFKLENPQRLLTWMRILPRQTKGVLTSAISKQPRKKSPLPWRHTWEGKKETAWPEPGFLAAPVLPSCLLSVPFGDASLWKSEHRWTVANLGALTPRIPPNFLQVRWYPWYYRWGYWVSEACVYAQLFSCVQLFVTPWAVAHQSSLSMEFSR